MKSSDSSSPAATLSSFSLVVRESFALSLSASFLSGFSSVLAASSFLASSPSTLSAFLSETFYSA
jgi:hypothetical protein